MVIVSEVLMHRIGAKSKFVEAGLEQQVNGIMIYYKTIYYFIQQLFHTTNIEIKINPLRLTHRDIDRAAKSTSNLLGFNIQQ